MPVSFPESDHLRRVIVPSKFRVQLPSECGPATKRVQAGVLFHFFSYLCVSVSVSCEQCEVTPHMEIPSIPLRSRDLFERRAKLPSRGGRSRPRISTNSGSPIYRANNKASMHPQGTGHNCGEVSHAPDTMQGASIKDRRPLLETSPIPLQCARGIRAVAKSECKCRRSIYIIHQKTGVARFIHISDTAPVERASTYSRPQRHDLGHHQSPG